MKDPRIFSTILIAASLFFTGAVAAMENGTEVNPMFVGNLDVQSDGDSFDEAGFSIAKILDFYNVDLLAANFKSVELALSESCSGEVQKYLDGLRTRETWALKSEYTFSVLKRTSNCNNIVSNLWWI